MSTDFNSIMSYFQSKSMSWFLYDRDLRHEIVKGKVQFLLSLRIPEFKYLIDRNCHGEKNLRSREFYLSQG